MISKKLDDGEKWTRAKRNARSAAVEAERVRNARHEPYHKARREMYVERPFFKATTRRKMLFTFLGSDNEPIPKKLKSDDIIDGFLWDSIRARRISMQESISAHIIFMKRWRAKMDSLCDILSNVSHVTRETCLYSMIKEFWDVEHNNIVNYTLQDGLLLDHEPLSLDVD